MESINRLPFIIQIPGQGYYIQQILVENLLRNRTWGALMEDTDATSAIWEREILIKEVIDANCEKCYKTEV